MNDKSSISILIVDDDEKYLSFFRDAIQTPGKKTFSDDAQKALSLIEHEYFDLVLLDLMLPRMNGLEILTKIKEVSPETVVLVMTGYGTVETSVQAMKMGAYDFIQKPFHLSHINICLDRAINFINVKRENIRLRQLKPHGPYVDIIGNSSSIKKVFDLIKKVAQTEVNILIQGESGTGKELVAQAIHNSSHRAPGSLIPVNCSAIPETLLESSLFGHRKGAFTGAYRDYPGLLHYANGGTLFLDEIGDMPLVIQAKLLRVLQTHKYRPLGGDKEFEVNMRIIAASNQNLEAAIGKNTFRADLFYRLNVVTITVPPLRERPSDIPQLARYFLKLFADPLQKSQIVDFAPDTLQVLKKYQWPGNVRELQNVVERAVSLTNNIYIQQEDLPAKILEEATLSHGSNQHKNFLAAKNNIVDKFEKQYLQNLLERSAGNLEEVLLESGLSRRQFFRILKKHQLSLKAYRRIVPFVAPSVIVGTTNNDI